MPYDRRLKFAAFVATLRKALKCDAGFFHAILRFAHIALQLIDPDFMVLYGSGLLLSSEV